MPRGNYTASGEAASHSQPHSVGRIFHLRADGLLRGTLKQTTNLIELQSNPFRNSEVLEQMRPQLLPKLVLNSGGQAGSRANKAPSSTRKAPPQNVGEHTSGKFSNANWGRGTLAPNNAPGNNVSSAPIPKTSPLIPVSPGAAHLLSTVSQQPKVPEFCFYHHLFFSFP